jgi:hypothetical protein
MASETTNDSSAPDVVIGNASPKTAAAAAVQAGGMSLKTVLGLVLATAVIIGVGVGAGVGHGVEKAVEQQNGQSTAQYSEQSQEQMLNSGQPSSSSSSSSSSPYSAIIGTLFPYEISRVNTGQLCRGPGKVAVSAHRFRATFCCALY